MRPLVTGATGFIGARLAARLHDLGHEVVAFGAERNGLEVSRRAALETRGVRVAVGSIDDDALLGRLVARADAVFHLAAAQHESHAPEAHFFAVNAGGTRRLLEHCAAANVERFVYGSTVGVFGSARNGALDETSPTLPDNAYTRSKLEAERIVRAAAARQPATILRIAETYGPGDGRLAKLFKAVDRGRPVPMIGGGTNEHHPVHVDDLVDGILRAAACDAAIGETLVLAGAEVLTTHRMVELVAEALGKPFKPLRLPLAPLKLAAVVLESGCRPFGAAPPLHRRRLDFFEKRWCFSQHKARRLIGYVPYRGFRDGAAETAAWYRDHGYL